MNYISPLRLAISPRSRRSLSLVAILCYLAVAGGFPLPQWKAIAISGAPFPCQSHACGCEGVLNCWHDCCCFTLAQRLDWAEAHHAAVPDDIRLQLMARRAVAEKPAAERACCSSGGRQAAAGQICEHKHRTVPVLPQLVRHCRGLASSWISCGAVTPPPARAACGLDLPLVDWLASPQPALNSLSERPDVPPPRV